MSAVTWVLYAIIMLAASVVGSWLGNRLWAWWRARQGDEGTGEVLEAFRRELLPFLGLGGSNETDDVMIRVLGGGDGEYSGRLVAMDQDTLTLLVESEGISCRWVIRASEVISVATRRLSEERMAEVRRMKEMQEQARKRLVESAARLNGLSDTIRAANEAKEAEKGPKVN